jgi:hypothetical protein
MVRSIVDLGSSLLVIYASASFFSASMEDRIYDWGFGRLFVASLLLFASFTAFAVLLKSIADLAIEIKRREMVRPRSSLSGTWIATVR